MFRGKTLDVWHAALGAYLCISSIYLVDRPEKRTFVLHERSGRYRESIARGGELERVALLSEVGGIVSDDLRLLRPFLAQAWRPHGGPDGTGRSLGKAEHHRGSEDGKTSTQME